MRGGVAALVSTALAATLLFDYYEYGNLVEEYAMPLIGASLFFFLEYLENDKITNLRVIICGACFGGVLMLRPNMISVWIVFCLYISCLLIHKKDFKELIKFAVLFAVGFFIVVLPIIVWLLIKGAFGYFVDDYLTFNILYSSAEGGKATFVSRWRSFFEFVDSPLVILAFIAPILSIYVKSNIRNNTIYLCYLVITIILMVLSGVAFAHYAMILIPALVYPFAIISKTFEDKNSFLLILLLAFEFICPKWISVISTIPETYSNRYISQRSEATDEVVNLVKSLTEDDEAITVFGSWDIIYVLSEREHATRYSYQTPIALMQPSIWDEYFEALDNEPPKLVVVQHGRYVERMEQFLNDHDYILVYAETQEYIWGGAQVYVR